MTNVDHQYHQTCRLLLLIKDRHILSHLLVSVPLNNETSRILPIKLRHIRQTRKTQEIYNFTFSSTKPSIAFQSLKFVHARRCIGTKSKQFL